MRGNFFITLFLWNGFSKITTFPLKFPKNFTFASVSASYQIEGAWNVDGKGESVWDRFTHARPNAIEDGKTGDDSAKSYYLYKTDSDLLKEMGVYRLSITWTRILPNGDLSEINLAGIQHYNNVINDLLEKKIQPMVTIYHWDMPQKLQDIGGWLNSSIADHMANYANILFYYFGDRVKWWLTINEPYIVVNDYSITDVLVGAPALHLGTPADYIVSRNLLMAHMRVYRLYEKVYKYQQKGKVTISLNYDVCLPKTQSQQDIDAAERHFQFVLGIFANPIFSSEGDYPKLVRDIVNENSKKEGYPQSRLPAFTEEEKSSLKGTYDFFSFNHYSSYLCSPLPSNESTNKIPSSFIRDMRVKFEFNNTLPKTEATKAGISPKAFRIVLNKISQRYNYPEIFVTENGYGDSGQLIDSPRINYFRAYLSELLKAYHYDKCNIIGYTAWSLIDNFEWSRGYTAKFGLVSVDFNSTDRTRTRKLSFYYFKKLISTREIDSVNYYFM